jgi:hypothetical protein
MAADCLTLPWLGTGGWPVGGGLRLRLQERAASESAEQSYVLVSEVQAKVRQQIEEISREQREQAEAAEAQAAEASRELAQSSRRFEETVTGMQVRLGERAPSLRQPCRATPPSLAPPSQQRCC